MNRQMFILVITLAVLDLVLALTLLASTSNAQVKAADSTHWKRCGEVYLFKGAPPVEFSVQKTSCFKGLFVLAHLLVEENGYCVPNCEVIGWHCEARSGQGLYCALGDKRLKAVPRRH